MTQPRAALKLRDGQLGDSRLKIAVVGSGISGLTAAYYLSPRYDVTLFEADSRPGGHTNTVEVNVAGRDYAIDTGFIVFNDRNYPNFNRLLDALEIERQPTTMSFSVHSERTGLEYNGTSLNGLFSQRTNLVRFSFLRMLRDVVRFGKRSTNLLPHLDENVTLGAYIRDGRFSNEFVEHYLIPMGAALWSAKPEMMLEFPAVHFLRFFDTHGMLELGDRPNWFVVKGGSNQYVRRLRAVLGDRLRLNSRVTRISRHSDGVGIQVDDKETEWFDRVVIAAHSDQALSMLADPSAEEARILGAIPYQENDTVLHTDERLLPTRRRAWASWNYRIPAKPQDRVAVTYNMNHLQSLPFDTVFNVTLNQTDGIAPDRMIKRITYHHPVFTVDALRAQRRRDDISGRRRTYYCGAYWGYGFHEDGVRSALDVCEKLNVSAKVG